MFDDKVYLLEKSEKISKIKEGIQGEDLEFPSNFKIPLDWNIKSYHHDDDVDKGEHESRTVEKPFWETVCKNAYFLGKEIQDYHEVANLKRAVFSALYSDDPSTRGSDACGTESYDDHLEKKKGLLSNYSCIVDNPHCLNNYIETGEVNEKNDSEGWTSMFETLSDSALKSMVPESITKPHLSDFVKASMTGEHLSAEDDICSGECFDGEVSFDIDFVDGDDCLGNAEKNEQKKCSKLSVGAKFSDGSNGVTSEVIKEKRANILRFYHDFSTVYDPCVEIPEIKDEETLLGICKSFMEDVKISFSHHSNDAMDKCINDLNEFVIPSAKNVTVNESKVALTTKEYPKTDSNGEKHFDSSNANRDKHNFPSNQNKKYEQQSSSMRVNDVSKSKRFEWNRRGLEGQKQRNGNKKFINHSVAQCSRSGMQMNTEKLEKAPIDINRDSSNFTFERNGKLQHQSSASRMDSSSYKPKSFYGNVSSEQKRFLENTRNSHQNIKRPKLQETRQNNSCTDDESPPSNPFRTARQVMGTQKSSAKDGNVQQSTVTRKCLGTRGPSSKYVSPFNKKKEEKTLQTNYTIPEELSGNDNLKNIDPKMVGIMMDEIMDHGNPIQWDDIAGLEFVKKTLKEIVVWPILRPDIFTGLRGPPKGILLFGPPGTGKTLIGKCIASQSKSTFFSISASSLGSKWVGEGEKLVRALFGVARCYQPAVIFIDEIDSLLTQRSETEHESSRRIKTEFLVQFDGVKTETEEKLLIVGATNRPQELDEAARRRLVKRLYIPLPEPHARKQIIKMLMANEKNELTENDINVICDRTDGYSGADMTNLCKEASLGPIRSIDFDHIATVTPDEVRSIVLNDFLEALNQVKASVSDRDLGIYADWNKKFGSCHEL